MHDSDFRSCALQAEFRGIAEYYRLAYNRHRLGRLKWVMERSLTKTLGHKHKISVRKVSPSPRHLADTSRTPAGPAGHCRARRREEATGSPLGRNIASPQDHASPRQRRSPGRLEEAPGRTCHPAHGRAVELCQDHAAVETHQVRRLKDLQAGNRADQPGWARQMAKRRRKTLIVCRACHDRIHHGTRPRQEPRTKAPESAVR